MIVTVRRSVVLALASAQAMCQRIVPMPTSLTLEQVRRAPTGYSLPGTATSLAPERNEAELARIAIPP